MYENLDLNKIKDSHAELKLKYKKDGMSSSFTNQKYDNIIKSKDMFTDELFPPTESSLLNYTSARSHRQMQTQKLKKLENRISNTLIVTIFLIFYFRIILILILKTTLLDYLMELYLFKIN